MGKTFPVERDTPSYDMVDDIVAIVRKASKPVMPDGYRCRSGEEEYRDHRGGSHRQSAAHGDQAVGDHEIPRQGLLGCKSVPPDPA